MTPEQIELVRAVAARAGASDAFAAAFYDRMFTVAPESAVMFEDIDAQRQKLADELGAMVSLLEDLDALDARAAELGARHRGYGVKAGHYRLARAAMVGALTEVLGDEFTAEEREAWERATSLITELMQGS